jgi:hypothetical protein
LIAIGAKKIETRSWHPRFQGPLAIHASKGGLSQRDFEETCRIREIRDALAAAHLEPRQLPRGAIVAICELDRAFSTNGNIPAYPERVFGDYSCDRFGWVLRDIRPLRNPIPYRGAQGWFDVPDELIAAQETASTIPATPDSESLF